MVTMDLFWGATIDIQPLLSNEGGRKVVIVGDNGETLIVLNVFTEENAPAITTTVKD